MEKTKTANQKSTVLALYPHHKALGYAVMDIPTDVRSSNYRYLTPKNPMHYIDYVSNLIERYQPDLILLESEKSRKSNRGTRMQEMFYRIEDVITKLNYPLKHYSRKVITDTFFGLNKPEIADMIIQQFPSYAEKRPQTRAKHDGSESPAWSEFDALSLVITHFAQMD